MKRATRSLVLLLILVDSLVRVQIAQAVVSLSVSPAVVGDTYGGPITLQIDGLTNEEKVVIKKYLDVNANGVIDSNDLMVLDFQLTSGQAGAMVIGGVTNVNVPFNSNTKTNAITATMNFQDGDICQSFIGQYLFELSSPSGQATSLLTVTNSPYAQKITGAVVTGTSDTVVPNAIVILFQPSGSSSLQAVAGAVANNA